MCANPKPKASEEPWGLTKRKYCAGPWSNTGRTGPKACGSYYNLGKGQKHYICVCNELGRALCSTSVHFSSISYVPALRKKTDHMDQSTPALREAGSMKNCSLFGLKNFAQFTHASHYNKMLLILDNHSTHCSAEAYDICREKWIVMVSLPPHKSHRLQPLDVVFYSPLKAAC